MLFDASFSKIKVFCDLFVAQALTSKLGNFKFPRSKSTRTHGFSHFHK